HDSTQAADPEEAEAISVIRGMRAAIRLGLERVLMLTDCRRLVRAFELGSDDLSWGALTLAPDMCCLASSFTAFRFCYFSRTFNFEAHALAAKVAGLARVNYGLLGDNLPPPSNVVSLLQSKKIPRIRIFGPDHTVLNALRRSGIKVVLGASNTDITRLGSDLSFAQDWVRTNVAPYAENVCYVVAGNELIPGQQAETILPAMKNLNSALKAANLAIPVSTAVSTKVLGKTYPPSAGEFEQSVNSVMRSITSFLAENRSPLLVNVYPYFSYVDNKATIKLDYLNRRNLSCKMVISATKTYLMQY
ncbi:hypothetical protein GIB67_002006, partial [Kingdonia uniflora]